MKIFVGFDDTDVLGSERGTGRLARWFGESLPGGIRLEGIVRQQLPRLPGIPFTSKNSSACLVVDVEEGFDQTVLIRSATEHIRTHFIEGSDPGLCVVSERQTDVLERLVGLAEKASSRIVSQDEAYAAAAGAHLSGHGGTEDGVIGAAAGIGLTVEGWNGRYIELGNLDLRALPDPVPVATLRRHGIRVLGVDRDAILPADEGEVTTHDWVRPQRWAGRPVLPVIRTEANGWEVAMQKRPEGHPIDG